MIARVLGFVHLVLVSSSGCPLCWKLPEKQVLERVLGSAVGPSGGFELFLNCCPHLAKGLGDGQSTSLWTIKRWFGWEMPGSYIKK
jgi:hypothetical protein